MPYRNPLTEAENCRLLILDPVGLTTCVDYQLVDHRTGSEVTAAPLVPSSTSTVSRESGRTFERMLYSQTFCQLGDDIFGREDPLTLECMGPAWSFCVFKYLILRFIPKPWPPGLWAVFSSSNPQCLTADRAKFQPPALWKPPKFDS